MKREREEAVRELNRCVSSRCMIDWNDEAADRIVRAQQKLAIDRALRKQRQCLAKGWIFDESTIEALLDGHLFVDEEA